MWRVSEPQQRIDGEGLPLGLYERLLTGDLRYLVDHQESARAVVEHVDANDVPRLVARYVAQRVEASLSQRDESERVQLINDLLTVLEPAASGQHVEPGPQMLREVLPLGGERLHVPSTPLSDVALMTNAQHEPQLFSELRLEMKSADSVDLLCAFVKNSGMRLLKESFDDLRRRGVPFRVLTTTYIGATDRKALDHLVRDYGAEVRINYNAQSTRLHAKAWLFRRRSGFHTGYVGSSNLSKDALLDGLEWNVRISDVATQSIMDKFKATFDTYWDAPEFESYDPDVDAERLDEALARNGQRGPTNAVELTSQLDVRPYPHQEEILEDLSAEREVRGIHRNLVVAATGTGKTVVAALDFRRLQAQARRPLRLLFLAHRKEILEQSLSTYRDVLKDGTFGELSVDGERPHHREQVFASVQGLGREKALAQWAPDHFDVIVVDEFHHASSASYRRILDHFRPQELLGLTATPERGDGTNVAHEFFGGRIASSIRLWDALEADLLVPFHYFGVADGTDLRDVAMVGSEYDQTALDHVLTGDTVRVRKILQALEETVTDLGAIKALGFCVSVRHAEFMAAAFNASGLSAAALSATTSREERRQALTRLRQGDLRCIFTVDLFNEGLDVPSVDTLLLLRPTQSATIFLQQLGRGLRRSEGKSVLTVLDFVGLQNRSFRFDLKLQALTGVPRHRLEHDVQRGFPFLPSGSQIVLDEVVQGEVIRSLKDQLHPGAAELIHEVHEQRPEHLDAVSFTLQNYLDVSGRSTDDIYGGKSRSYQGEKLPLGWTMIKLKAFPDLPSEGVADEWNMLLRVRNLSHIDDVDRISAYRRLLNTTHHGAEIQRDPYARMLFFTFWPGKKGAEVHAGLNWLSSSSFVREEILELLDVRERELRSFSRPLPGRLQESGLRSHARYSRDEVLAAVGVGTTESGTPGSTVTGVKYVAGFDTDVLFVTLQKSEADYSPTTRYKDYAINQSHFHWETQGATTPTSETGQRYVHHEARGSSVLLFVRTTKEGNVGTEPYICLGTVRYMRHQGSQPMQIVWELDRPMPAELLLKARAVA